MAGEGEGEGEEEEGRMTYTAQPIRTTYLDLVVCTRQPPRWVGGWGGGGGAAVRASYP